MNTPIQRLLSFELTGPIAQFRKYYSNISALTYEIPPRTVIAGLLASVLELPRDSYYNLFSPDKCKITVRLKTGTRKYMAYTNYRNPDKGQTIQTRVELLFPSPDSQNIRYVIFLSHQNEDFFRKLYRRLENGSAGYGLYFGQRQFRANIRNVHSYNPSDLNWKNDYEGDISTATTSENIISLNYKAGHDIISSSMPIHMKKINDGREPLKKGEIVYETTGQNLEGTFKEVLELSDTNIAFMALS